MLVKMSRQVLPFLLLIALGTVRSDVDYNNPVRSAAEDEIIKLPGLSFEPGFRQYSGYLRAGISSEAKKKSTPPDLFWHYWLIESKSSLAEDPLVLWLNGGPGCSSLLGLLTELGPFRMLLNGTLAENSFAWNKRANLLFMESPAGVGYSYAAGGDVETDDNLTARHNYLALKSFMRKHPQFANRSLHLTGESYGGVYLTVLAVLVDADPELNLRGVAIGNGYLNAHKLDESLVYFSYYHGLIGSSTWDGLSRFCCSGKPPTRHQCKFTISGYNKDKCDEFASKATISVLSSGLNPYNIYDKCEGGDLNGSYMLDVRPKFTDIHKWVKIFFLTLRGTLDMPCTNYSAVNDYLRKPDVRRALHIPMGLATQFSSCSEIKYNKLFAELPGGLSFLMHQLIRSPRKLKLLVYNGDVDMMCNFLGNEWFVDDLGQRVVCDYSPWFTNGQISGFAKYYDGIAFFTVKGAGHMVPADRPAEALNMFEQFLDGMQPTCDQSSANGSPSGQLEWAFGLLKRLCIWCSD